MESFSVRSAGPEQTSEIAAVLARRLGIGDVVLLTGGLASGKTTFVKGIAEALGSADTVTSPTFMLAQFYASPRGRILHVDTYRLSGLPEYRDLGLEEEAAASITVVEWGERVAAAFPCHLTVEFEVDVDGPDMRTLRFSSSGDRWTAVLPELRAALTARVR